MFILHTIHSAVFLLFGLPLLYLAVLTAAALVARSRRAHTTVPSGRLTRFTFVVPAHNEEGSIERTLRSLRAVEYPADRFETVVVADNCTDETALRARREGARVLERTDHTLRGKGYALRWAFDRLLHEPDRACEAIVVIDADTVVSGNYLSMLNVAIGSGADVMQTSDLVAPVSTAWTTEALRLSFMLYNYVRPLGRRALGFSAGLRGNGMCFTRRALERVPWHAFSKAEDLEYGLQMLLAGYRTVFVPEARALATMPEKPANAESQRARWEGGRLPVIRRYAGALLASALTHRSLASLDAFIDLATPAFVNMMGVSAVLCGVSAAAWALSGSRLEAAFACAWAAALLAGAAHVMGGVAASGDPTLRTTLRAVPRYVVWKVMLYFKLARAERSEEWVRTTREL